MIWISLELVPHCNLDLLLYHGRITEFHKKYLKFLKMKKILDKKTVIHEKKSLNYQLDAELTKYLMIYYSANQIL